MTLKIGNKYSVESRVSFDQYTMYEGSVLEVVPDSLSKGRLVMSKDDFKFVADKEHTKSMIDSGKLKLINN